MKNLLISLTVIATGLAGDHPEDLTKDKREYYSITVYHFKTPEQRQKLDDYLQFGWLPAVHRLGFRNVGVFSPLANDTVADKRIFVIMPAKSIESIAELNQKIFKDESHEMAAKNYIDAVYNDPPFSRIEKIISYAFRDAPVMVLPKLHSGKSERVYEYRSYESPTEKIFRNKVQMFNEGGEVKLFKRLNFNAIFYSEVVAGSNMPNLIYMTSFESMADRDAHWASFRDDPEWKKLSADPIYQHNVSRIDLILMKAAEYSDF
jgi:hypothetical protein